MNLNHAVRVTVRACFQAFVSDDSNPRFFQAFALCAIRWRFTGGALSSWKFGCPGERDILRTDADKESPRLFDDGDSHARNRI